MATRADVEEFGEDFQYIVRIAETDLDGLRPLGMALTAINGVGQRVALTLCEIAELERTRVTGTLSPEEQANLLSALETFPEVAPVWMLNRQRDLEAGDELHLFGQDLTFTHEDDVSRMRRMRSYRGVRHATHHKVRGQRTRSNGRRGLTLGVSRKK